MIVSALVSAGALPLVSGANAHATQTPAASGDEAEAAEETLELFVAPDAAVTTDDATELKFSVLLRNSGELSAPEGSVELAIGERLTGTSATPRAEDLAVDPAADPTGDPTDASAPPARTVIATASVDAVSSGKSQHVTVTVPIKDAGLTSSAHGVYPIYATYRASDADAASSLTAFSPLVWGGPAEASATVDLTSIVPLTLSTKILSLPTRAQLGQEAGRLTALMDYAVQTQSIVAIDPRFVVAVRGYGLEAPQAARDLLARLESATIPTFLLQFGDADPAAQAALGASELLQPAGFEFVTRFGAWEQPDPAAPGEGDAAEAADPAHPASAKSTASSQPADPADPPEPTEPPDAAEPAEPTEPTEPTDPANGEVPPPSDEQLTEWQHGVAAAWPAPGQVGPRTLSLLRAAELDTTVLRSDNVSLSGGPRASLGDASAIITDAELDAGVQLALSGASETERALGGAQAAARLALTAGSDTKGLVLGVDRGGSTDAEHPEQVLSELTTQRWIKPIALGAQQEGTAQLAAALPDEDRLELLDAATENEATVLEARATLVNPEYLDGYQRLRLLTLFATRNAAPDADFSATAKQFAKRDRELHDGVRLVGTKRAQLVGGSTKIPIQLRNSLPFDAVVTLEVAPTSAALRVPERTFPEIVLPEDSSERVLVPTTSRVSSGDSALLLSITSIDGEYTASSGKLEITISSAVETVAIAVLASAAALLIGFGIWRSVRRRRTHSPRE
ncbi:hypothetical protein GCM10010471_17290 [Leucobacter komagatae]